MGIEYPVEQVEGTWLAKPLTTQVGIPKSKKIHHFGIIWVIIMMLTSGCVQTSKFPQPDDNNRFPNNNLPTEEKPTFPTWTPDFPSNRAFNPTTESHLAETTTIREQTPTPGQAGEPPQNNLYPLIRPILPPGRVTIDPTYRFGMTQNGEREPHHGVEFLNSFGTPVTAAADGTVVFAGNDNEQDFGPHPNFYGLVVILKHDLPGYPQPIFTLYAHLSSIHVEESETVQAGQIIGEVGLSGIALGSHLHFEVRYGKNHYDHVRNPELWLQPLRNENGKTNGAISGIIINESGSNLSVSNITINLVPDPASGETSPMTVFLESTYADLLLTGQDPWKENFALGNIPPGKYQISFVQNGLQKQVVEVESGAIATIRFVVRETDP